MSSVSYRAGVSRSRHALNKGKSWGRDKPPPDYLWCPYEDFVKLMAEKYDDWHAFYGWFLSRQREKGTI